MISLRQRPEPAGPDRIACLPLFGLRLVGAASLVALTLACAPSDVMRARERSLPSTLQGIRQCIQQFRLDKGRFPMDLQELVSAHYLRKVPVDPVTGTSATWHPVFAPVHSAAPALPQLIDVRSGAPGLSTSGTPYASW